MSDIICDSRTTGTVDECIYPVRDKVNYYKEGNLFYIGYTNNPETRWNKHSNNGKYQWYKMILLYETSSIDRARRMERWLIAYYKESRNLVPGGAGNDGPGTQYVYLLIT